MNTSSKTAEPPARRAPVIDWLVQLNRQVSGWAASVSWWRLIVLFIVILIAAGVLSDVLNLKHERVKVIVPGTSSHRRDPVVTIDKDGIRVEPRGAVEVPAIPKPGASDSTDATPPEPGSSRDEEAEEDEPQLTTRRVITFRGIVGDLGSAVLVLLFAYLVASKIVVRKVAQADEKVRSAVHVAEREAMERQLVQARLQVLQAQVEPHFLFNTLSAVDYLIETDPARASQMQKKLITYLRGALPQMRQETSTLGREMRLVRSYLDLIKMRIEDRLDIEVNVPESLEAAEFPPMMLQSLVENAIKHGIEPKPEGGKVSVGAKVQGQQLWVEVRDTGVGVIDPEQLESPTSGTGIGLQNIRERLAMLYPGKGRLTLMSDDRLGTVVRIGVPFKLAEPKPEEGAAREEKTA
ncbi:MAG TPA: histidine kinase [Ramlibacter sp.]|uniref:sensor histidine kinase n=1 Tax=Ramlibacter sp. TaxID=1917967 RepID=UPI002B9F618A|nr:histidine kinase [Ramlibacter sp.]HVZ44970.1 histidine kinase [Ramlibacter sp.]